MLETSLHNRREYYLHQRNSGILEGKWYTGKEKGTKASYGNPLERVHRLVALTWLKDEFKKGFVIHHLDENGFNNRADNLVWRDSTQHAIDHNWQEADEKRT